VLEHRLELGGSDATGEWEALTCQFGSVGVSAVVFGAREVSLLRLSAKDSVL
jgi:hypothetical protein